MVVRKPKLIAAGFALVAVLSLVAAVLPAFKGQGQPLHLEFLGAGVVFLVISIVAWRKPGGSGGSAA